MLLYFGATGLYHLYLTRGLKVFCKHPRCMGAVRGDRYYIHHHAGLERPVKTIFSHGGQKSIALPLPRGPKQAWSHRPHLLSSVCQALHAMFLCTDVLVTESIRATVFCICVHMFIQHILLSDLLDRLCFQFGYSLKYRNFTMSWMSGLQVELVWLNTQKDLSLQLYLYLYHTNR